MHKIMPSVIITMGDPAGIGPEVIIKAFNNKRHLFQLCRPAVIGDFSVLKKYIKNNNLKFNILNDKRILRIPANTLNIVDLKTIPLKYNAGEIDRDSGLSAIKYIDFALSILKENKYKIPLVTAPVCKEAILKAGIKFKGHTEYLAQNSGSKKPAMVFVSAKNRILLVTRHIPHKEVSSQLTKNLIVEQVLIACKTLNKISPVKKVIMCGLNPHCGEGGAFGNEEIKIVEPAIRQLKDTGMNVIGPVSADWIFYCAGRNIPEHSLVVCQYHDQAMIPLKSVFGLKLVNLTCGLKFIRTSPAHGTGFDIAGKNLADPTSMIEAIRLAAGVSK